MFIPWDYSDHQTSQMVRTVIHASRLMAHAQPDSPVRTQSLLEHLEGTSERAARFASGFGSTSWSRTAALLHDLGKASEDFQRYLANASGLEASAHLETSPGRVNHSSAGALWAYQQWGQPGLALAYLISGHHAGLPDWVGGEASLSQRLQQHDHLSRALAQGWPMGLPMPEMPLEPPKVAPDHPEDAHVWLRMLFSCLIDADFLDTEKFMGDGRATLRPASDPDLAKLKGLLDAHMEGLAHRAPATRVNEIRHQVLEACRDGATLSPGFFSLTVPTGGGKTLASMVFALSHAIRHGKRRIVVVIPYTSIIEQTAEVLTGVFGPNSVLEHHSSLDPEKETHESRLAAENWDSPIIVTTNVQFFESLFAAKTSACRKLHNLVDSVVIFDEAQMLPPQYLKPILQSLGSLVRHYGVSAVLCTATQPALMGKIGSEGAAFEGLQQVRELMPNPTALALGLRRTKLRLHASAPVTWDALAAELARMDCVLCIVNTRRDCRELHALMPQGTIHLSALMCPQHRSDVIQSIKDRLKSGQPTRVISTQLVEAGVDLDFPVVYRALAGLDSMAQAAGRCNREGNLDHMGDVVLFMPPKPAPTGLLRKGADTAKELLRRWPACALGLEPDSFERYFRLFYARINSFDEKNIHDLLVNHVAKLQFQFREAAKAFQLIEDEDQKTVIVRYGPHRERVDRLVTTLRQAGPNRDLLRALQRFSVAVPSRVVAAMHDQCDVEEVQGLWIQAVDGLYDNLTGLCPDFARFNPGLFTV